MPKNPGQARSSSSRRAAWTLLGAAAMLLVSLAYVYTQGETPSEPLGNVQPGEPAPDFSLDAVRGGSYRLAELWGQAVLLSFINTQAGAGAATPDPSRSQIVFLKSMETQYSSQGLQVLIVDAAHAATGKRPSADELLNFTYNWDLERVPVLDDRSGATARQYGVPGTPTTFLIDAQGVVQQRWDGFASAPQLAFALQALVGVPEYAEEYASVPQADGAPDCAATPAQAKFAGLGPARPLSPDIWVVDGGQSWTSGQSMPLAWVVLGGEGDLHLKVTLESSLLVDESASPLPQDEAQGLVLGLAEAPSNVYLVYTSVTLESSGCLRVEAVVTPAGETTPLYHGEAFVPVN